MTYDEEKCEGGWEGRGDREVIGEGAEEERVRRGKPADVDVKTCSPLKNCRPDAPGRRNTMKSVRGDGRGRGNREVTWEGVVEERGKGKRAVGDVKTCMGVGAR